MYSLIVITDSQTSIGFRLAGVTTRVAESVEEAREQIYACLEDETIGVIALSEDLAHAVDYKLETQLEHTVFPTIILIPSGNRLTMGVAQQEMLKSLIKSAIGFDLKLPA